MDLILVPNGKEIQTCTQNCALATTSLEVCPPSLCLRGAMSFYLVHLMVRRYRLAPKTMSETMPPPLDSLSGENNVMYKKLFFPRTQW